MSINPHHTEDVSKLHMACNSSNLSLSQNFTDDVNTPDKHGNVPLHLAINRNDLEKCKTLLRRPNNDVNYKNHSGETPLCLSIRRCQHDTSMVKQLLEAGCDLNLLSGDGEAPLHITMRRNRTDLAHELIKKGADVNVLDDINRSPLEFAVDKNNMEAVCMLLYYGANVDNSLKDTTALLVFAIYVRRDNIAQMLYSFYDDFSYTTSLGSTVLHVASRALSPLAIDLVNAGADVNCLTVYGESPLFLSLRYEDSKLFKLIWPKVDCDILLGCQEPFLYTYMQRARFSTPEFLECLHLMLSSPKAFELLEELILFSSFVELLNSFYYFSIEPNDRLAVINVCLSLGFTPNICDINRVFHLYGFGDELEAFIYSFSNDHKYTSLEHASPLLGFILAMEEYSEIKTSDLHSELLRTYASTCNPFNAFKYFSMPLQQKILWRNYLLDSSSKRKCEMLQNLLVIPEFPSLLELSRNKAYAFIQAIYNFTTPYQFHDLAKSLKLPPCIQDILRFKRPIYEQVFVNFENIDRHDCT